MTISKNLLLATLLVGTVSFAGCAKEQIVKKDEPLAQNAAAKQAGSSSTASPAALASQDQSKLKGSAVKESGAEALAAKAQADATAKAARANEAANAKAASAAAQAELGKALQTIYFDFDSSSLSDASRQALAQHLERLKQNPRAKLKIEGYCDERGSDDYNLALGERRAQSAAQYLKTLGLSAERISTISYGNEKPADPGHNEAAWAKNRRDEFVVQN